MYFVQNSQSDRSFEIGAPITTDNVIFTASNSTPPPHIASCRIASADVENEKKRLRCQDCTHCQAGDVEDGGVQLTNGGCTES